MAIWGERAGVECSWWSRTRKVVCAERMREKWEMSQVMPGEALAGQCKVIYFSVCEMGH